MEYNGQKQRRTSWFVWNLSNQRIVVWRKATSADHLVTYSHKSIVASLQISSWRFCLSPRGVTAFPLCNVLGFFCLNMVAAASATSWSRNQLQSFAPLNQNGCLLFLSLHFERRRGVNHSQGVMTRNSTSEAFFSSSGATGRTKDEEWENRTERAGDANSQQGLLPTELPIKTSYYIVISKLNHILPQQGPKFIFFKSFCCSSFVTVIPSLHTLQSVNYKKLICLGQKGNFGLCSNSCTTQEQQNPQEEMLCQVDFFQNKTMSVFFLLKRS